MGWRWQRLVLAGVAAGVGAPAIAQTNQAPKCVVTSDSPQKFWVYLTDKGVPAADLPQALAQLEQTYDPHAINRRRLRRTDPGLFDERDLPIAAPYRTAIDATGASVHVESRWLNAASVWATPAQRQALSRLPCVRRVEPVRAGHRQCGATCEDAERLTTPYAPRDFYGLSSDQLNQINLVAVHQAGYHAQNVRIGILDTGFRRDHVVFQSPEHPLTIIAEHDFIHDDDNTSMQDGDDPDQFTHGTLILGTLASYMPGAYVGSAYGASFILCMTEVVATETPVEEDNYVGGLEFIEAHGGDVATSSLGYIDWYTQADLNGHTAVTTVAVNAATANGLICCTAAGNEGHDADPSTSNLIAPADALQVITCGAADANGDIAWFSSDGPTADGRLKPELLALGLSTSTIWYNDTTSFATASGTSLSTPLVAGAVACLAGAHPDWTVDHMRSALFSTASDGVPDELFIRGYGLVNASAAAGPLCGLADFNGDGDIGTDPDIEAFFACLAGDCCDTCGKSDFNGDGDVGTDADIEAFFRVLAGGSC